ncbi:Uncharacterised protein [uncultured archaeon]|nr:Uncharacterised protein [uncultured archaeon]
MALQMRYDDEIRMNILNALLGQGAVFPNIRHIQRKTGYHKATIKASLDFLAKEGLITGYGPKMDFKKFGYNLEVLTFFHADLTKKRLLENFCAKVKKDPHIYFLSGAMGSGNWNLMARHVYRDMESCHRDMNDNYFASMDRIHDFIKAKETFYVTEPFYKLDSRIDSMVRILRKSRGLD